MDALIRIAITFLLVSLGASLLIGVFNVEFGQGDFWDHHGVFFLVFIALFPRLTLLFSSVPFGGLFWWMGWIFAPRFLVAMLATIAYWHSNKVLVVISWLVCVGGESSEKVVIHRETRSTMKGQVIDAEYEIKS